MRLLVLGGTVFCSREVAAEAVRRGHEVVCACRGVSGPVPDGARLVRWDRAAEPPPVDEVGEVDAVVDVARLPSQVRAAVAAWPEAHHVFVSTVNVYADDATPGQTPATGVLREPQPEDVALEDDPDAYGRMKVACEDAVRAGAASASVVRPGLIVGPGDPTGRFTYWPERLAAVAEGRRDVLAPDPAATSQVIDVRDLAAWLVDLAERRSAGTWDGVGPARPLGELLAEVANGVANGVVDGGDVSPRWHHLDDDTLEQRGVAPWMGDRSLPLWLPRPAYDGMAAHDVAPSLEAGLVVRPLAETARDTLAWARSATDVVRTGLSAEEEAAVLAGGGLPA